MSTIIELAQRESTLSEQEKALFSRFYQLTEKVGEMRVPNEMKQWVDQNFPGYNAESQKIISIFSKLTYETALYNEMRSHRPMAAKSDDDVQKVIEQSKGDPFCNVLKLTPEDKFGRIKGKFCTTAANVAKYDGMHSVIVFKEHNPLKFNEKQIIDYIETGQKWFAKANKTKRECIYPFMLWNCLWKSGASIVHGHMQVVLSEGRHYAEAEMIHRLLHDYKQVFGADYASDLFAVHKSLGLGFEHKHLKIFCNLVPRKDKEITIISPKPDKEFSKAVYKIVRTLIEDFGVESFNMGVVLPPLDGSWEGFPVVARIVDRGKLSNKTTDVAGMELYARSAIIETDPYKIVEKLLVRF